MTKPEVVGLGALNIDHIYQVERFLGDGETAADKEPVASVSRYREAERKFWGTFPGGSAANTIYGLAKLGIRTGFIGVVGDDNEGNRLIQDFQTVGVDISQIKVKPKAKTGSALCLGDKLNFRKISVSPGTANSLLTINDIDLDYVNQAEILHISSFVDDAQLGVLRELVDKLDSSVKISFSPGALYAARGLKALAPILGRTHVLFANRDEIRQLTGRGYVAGSELCRQHGGGIVVVTLGKGVETRGGIRMKVLGKPTQTGTGICYIRDTETPHGYYVLASEPTVEFALDTIGAGDAFATGFLYGHLKGAGLKKCGLLGDIVARFSMTKMGARQGLPTFNELSQRYRELYHQPL